MPDQTPGRRVQQSLVDAIGRAAPGERSDGDLPVAATVVLLRDGADGPEVLLIERPDRGSFAGAWVFPGGKLEDADRRVADEPEEDVARRAGVRETREETGIEVDPGTLVTLSVWEPPPGLALRIRTWFFAATAPGGAIALSPDEAIAWDWIRPADAVARHGRGELTLYPPTWVTLHELSEHPDAASILDTARVAGMRRYQTVARRSGDGPVLLWQDDAEYEADAAPGGTARHRLEIGSLPWSYERRE